jgi:hypothetical protein
MSEAEKGRSVAGECDRNMVLAAANRAITRDPEINRRFMGNLRSAR